MMPIHEYRCQACGHGFEKLQRMNDASLVDCPECGEPRLKRLVSAAAFRLKGTGWYETDFKQDHKHNLADSTDGSSGKDTGKSNGVANSKDKNGSPPANKTSEKTASSGGDKVPTSKSSSAGKPDTA